MDFEHSKSTCGDIFLPKNKFGTIDSQADRLLSRPKKQQEATDYD